MRQVFNSAAALLLILAGLISGTNRADAKDTAPAAAAYAEGAGGASTAACLPEGGLPIPVTGPNKAGFFRTLPGETSAKDVHHYVLTDIAGAWSAPDTPIPASGQSLWAWPQGKPNRWGLTPAWITADSKGGALLQIQLIERGLALAAPYLGSMACSKALIAAEKSARVRRQGRWKKETALSTMNLNALTASAGHYVLVEGRIVSLGKSSRTRYLNFGRNWKTDFTATLSTKQEKSFSDTLASAGISLEDLAGHAVQIRGVVDLNDGPHIHMTHPGQLIILDGNEDRK